MLLKIRNKYLIKNILNSLEQKLYLKLIKYNKKIQKKLNFSIKDYKEYNQIEIEITPVKNNISGNFINIEKNNKSFFHIYFDNKRKRRNYISVKDNISKIKIIIDYEIKSFKKLFDNCHCISNINFIKFNRNDIKDMSFMFNGCINLININFSNFKTDKVINMEYMFVSCYSLKELNLSNFNTSKVINMKFMFKNCRSLKELNLLNFDTSKVINMDFMFNNCSSLNNLDISKFEINDNTDINYMFSRCSNDLKIKIKEQNKKINENAFEEDDIGNSLLLNSFISFDSSFPLEPLYPLYYYNFYPI